MAVYISLLRGINVSGKNLIKMEALKQMYQNLGFQQVTTYLQSGNVVFEANLSEIGHLQQKIEQQIQHEFGLNVPVLVLTLETLQQIIGNQPFLSDTSKETAFFHVTFLFSPPEPSNPQIMEDKKQADEALVITNHAVYLYCPNGYGQTKLTNTFFESKLAVNATTRNWKTSNELLKIALELSLKHRGEGTPQTK